MWSFLCQQDLTPPANIRLPDQEWKTSEHLIADRVCHQCEVTDVHPSLLLDSDFYSPHRAAMSRPSSLPSQLGLPMVHLQA